MEQRLYVLTNVESDTVNKQLIAGLLHFQMNRCTLSNKTVTRVCHDVASLIAFFLLISRSLKCMDGELHFSIYAAINYGAPSFLPLVVIKNPTWLKMSAFICLEAVFLLCWRRCS